MPGEHWWGEGEFFSQLHFRNKTCRVWIHPCIKQKLFGILAGYKIISHQITGWFIWKGPLEVTWSNLPAPTGPPRANCTEPCPDIWSSPGMEIPEIPHPLCHFRDRGAQALQITPRNPQPCQLLVDAGLDTSHVFNSKGVKCCLGSIWKAFLF